MTTKTTCRIVSDVDLLSRVQLEEVVRMLEGYGSKHAIDFVTPEEPESLKLLRAAPGSPERMAVLMSVLLDRECDVLVLDASALPTKMPAGLTIGALTRRITPYDALISNDDCILDELRENATLVTSSMRREAQLRYYRPDLKIARMQGSIDAVLQKVKSAKVDCAVVAAADVERLSKQEFVAELLTNSVCVPAAGQGALAVLIRSSEDQFKDTVQSINDPATHGMLRAEWSFLEHLEVDPAAPVAVLASIEGKALELEGMVAFPDGSEKIQCMVKGTIGNEEDLGRTLAVELLESGGREVIEEFRLT
ncbi:MAG TPA: hydroxymethylbilane synthase [Candidatus Krumholzibacteria bacterium]|nr:hydroxymethylbilane synthase [Candidatus Krumholzibacteria bacterium]